jgi:NADH:ubiquinone reductase (H+-translocating)
MAELVHRQHGTDMTRADSRDGTGEAEVRGRPSEESVHRIVVVGGGAAGLELATRLGDRLGRRGRAQVALVDSARTHLWKPLLHEVAAGSLDPGENELSYLAQAHWHHFRYRLGEMVGLDRARREVLLAATFDDEKREVTPPRGVGYDTLVIAIGSVTNDFGTPGVLEHAVPLETPAQAERFSKRLVNAFAHRRNLARCDRASSTSRLSAAGRPAPSCRPSSIAPLARWSPMDWIASIPSATFASS